MNKKRKYDIWTFLTLGALLIYILFMVYPLFNLFLSSIIDKETNSFSLQYFQKFFSKRYYYNTVFNSFKVTFCVTICTIIIATPLAYVMETVKIKGSGAIRIIILLSSMSAPFIGAYSWILLLGRNGAITNFMKNTFGIKIPDIYGFGGIVLVLTLQLVPLVFMYVSGALKNVDNSLIEAAESMGCTGVKLMWRVIVPLIVPTILAGGILVFMRALSDFGTPMLIGEGYKTIPVLIYTEFMGENGGDDGFAAAISILVIILALLAFLVQKFFANKLSFSMSALNPIAPKKLKGIKNILAHMLMYFYCLLAILPQISIFINSFRKTSGMIFKKGFALTSYQIAFSRMNVAIKNTFIYAFIAILIIVVIAVVISYATVRRRNIFTNLIDLITMMPYIIPGSILAICTVTSFNKKPLVLTGTALIMIVMFVIKRMPYTIRSSSAILRNISISTEEAALSLGASSIKTFVKITAPMMFSGVLSGAIMSFITIITELSCSIMMYTGRTKTMTVAIYSEVVRGNYGVASALAVILNACVILSVLLIFKVTGKKELSI